jgi:hypothetical protein
MARKWEVVFCASPYLVHYGAQNLAAGSAIVVGKLSRAVRAMKYCLAPW